MISGWRGIKSEAVWQDFNYCRPHEYGYIYISSVSKSVYRSGSGISRTYLKERRMGTKEFLEIMNFLNGLRDSPFIRPDEYYSMIDLIRSRIVELYEKEKLS